MNSIDDILKMAQNVQAELEKAQANLDTIEVEGASGGGLVKVRASAKGRIIGVSIDDSLLDVSEKQMLEDLITAAFNDARAKADAISWAGCGFCSATNSATSAMATMAGLAAIGGRPAKGAKAGASRQSRLVSNTPARSR